MIGREGTRLQSRPVGPHEEEGSTMDRSAKRKLLREHAEAYWKGSGREALPTGYGDREIASWKKLVDRLLENERFVELAHPVTEETVLPPNSYAMRFDGVYVFFEAFVRDGENREIISGNPMRYPWDEKAPAFVPYRSHDTESIFDQPVKLITKVKDDHGQKSHLAQIDESEAIVRNQRYSAHPIAPFSYRKPYTEAHVFARKDFVFHFPARGAIRFMRDELAFEPIVKGCTWLLEEAHRRPWSSISPFELDALGATGSAAFGDEHDLEDFDVVFFGDLKRLQEVRDFIIAGTHAGEFRPFVSNFKRRLRVANRSLPVEEIGGHVVFCSFLCLDDPREDPMYDASIELVAPLESVEGRVVDDGANMLSPSRVVLDDLCGVRPEGALDELGSLPLILMHGNCRGQFAVGNWLRVERPTLCRVRPRNGEAFTALLSIGWRDVDITYW